ncbi:MAG: B12-binding domain-containing radical SAM protein [Candidatus Omnitrophica bacterium]|nr:B12-binding domain-containing radical SAM protein [Candidatus Omnitrophota bacterium]
MNNITLINPPHFELKLNYSSIFHPPLGLCYIASYMREKGHNVHVIDAVGQAMDKRSGHSLNRDIVVQGLATDEIVNNIPAESDVIGITCMFTPVWPYVRELVKAIKKRFPDIPLVMGGEHATGMWEAVLSSSPVDFCVLGEGEITFEELTDSIKKGDRLNDISGIAYMDGQKPIANKPRPRIRNLDSIPPPAWDLIDVEKYIERGLFMGASKGRTMPIIATRGCPYRCRFCTARNMWGSVWVPRSVEKVVDEIEFYMNKYKTNDFHLMDLTAIIRKDWIVRFANEILRRNLGIRWQLPVGTRTVVIDKEVTELLVKSGCRDITFAPESGSKDVLDKMGKTIDLRQLENSIKAAISSKMTVCLFFLIGFPGETVEDIKKTFKLIRKMALIGVHEIAISTFIPIPGTSVFDELKEKDPKRFELTNEFYFALFSSLSLNKTDSWNSSLSKSELLGFKIRGLIMFYAISFAIRPWRFVRLLVNLFTGKQETKVDRVLQEMLYKHRRHEKK